MSRKPRTAKARRKPAKRSASRKPTRHGLLDALIAGSADALGLAIDKAWLPAVRGNLEVTLRHGARVASFALPDDAEPAPVFRS